MTHVTNRPRIAVIPGDPNGIGPELIARLLADPQTSATAEILLVGERAVVARGERDAGVELPLAEIGEPANDRWPAQGIAFHETHFFEPGAFRIGEVDAAAGRSSLRTLDLALDFARANVVDGVLFGPFNKAALIAAGMGHGDELHYMAERLGTDGYFCELNTMDGLWTSRVTSHIPLGQVAASITGESILDAVELADRTVRASGVAEPRIAVAALNPHAGDNGNFGREEIDVIRPAVEAAKARGLNVTGPWPSDTVFIKAQEREVDAVVTMYHDQGQIAMKLMGFHRGVTVQGGLEVPVATPAHGTAYDISGKGVARIDATRQAFLIVSRMAAARRAARESADAA